MYKGFHVSFNQILSHIIDRIFITRCNFIVTLYVNEHENIKHVEIAGGFIQNIKFQKVYWVPSHFFYSITYLPSEKTLLCQNLFISQAQTCKKQPKLKTLYIQTQQGKGGISKIYAKYGITHSSTHGTNRIMLKSRSHPFI